MSGTLRIIFVFAIAAVVLLMLLPWQLLALLFVRLGFAGVGGIVPVIFHRLILILFGVKVHINGKYPEHRPLLIVANHQSWLDIVVLGSTAPLSFVAKYDMASWPIFGQLAKLQRTVFVKRERRRESSKQAGEIADRMTAREVMVLFPEGTTTDGNKVAPFKTPLFQAAKLALADSPVETASVLPVAIEYNRLHGLPIGRSQRPHVAWPGEVGLAESLLPLIREGALDVVVHVGESLTIDDTSDRKLIAAQAASSIRNMLDSSVKPR